MFNVKSRVDQGQQYRKVDSTRQSESMPWIEKYRPNHFDDIVLDPLNRVFFRNIIDKPHFPNLLFYGPPGTGKTTTIINLINEYQTKHTRRNKESVIHLNASDERGIDIIRSQIYQFVRSRHIFESGYKFVILDEVDYMTKTAQQALKTLLQTCHANVRFCLICNYISKIDESLQQEFISVRFNQLPWGEIHQFIRKIASTENLRLSDDDIALMKDAYQSDIRSMINFLQMVHSDTDNTTATASTTATAKTTTQFINMPMISIKEWNHLHALLECAKTDDAIEYTHYLSDHHNMHKKQIMIGYMNFVIRNHTHRISDALLESFEHISHVSDDMRICDIVRYFVLNLSHCYSSSAAATSLVAKK